MKLISIFLISLGILFAGEAEENFAKANEYYKSGEYAKAIDTYTTILNNGYRSSSLYFNLANSYYKLDEIGLAILYYEKAKKLNPTDEDIEFNLKIAQLKTVDKIDKVPEFYLSKLWKDIVGSMNSNMWSYISIIIFFLFVLSIAIFIFSRSPVIKKAFFALGVIFMVSAITLSIASYQRLSIDLEENTAIITVPSVYVKSAPSDSSTDLLILHEGTKINILAKDGDWRKFKLTDGTEGWLHSNAITVI
jgi:tetratricopeptide (TPR) repeat protein